MPLILNYSYINRTLVASIPRFEKDLQPQHHWGSGASASVYRRNAGNNWGLTN
ncbi:hypothetical protein ACFL2Q_14815 [Thermodesulfobacteriota bacterium]